MFRTLPAADPPTPPDVDRESDLIQLVPLSVLELDLPAPVEGWPTFLAARGVAILLDDLGRAAVNRDNARRLFTEKREREARAREHAAVVERRAIEQDQRFRASLNPGVSWYQIPDGVTPAAAMLQAAHDAGPRRQSLVEEAFSNPGETTFHPMPDGDEW